VLYQQARKEVLETTGLPEIEKVKAAKRRDSRMRLACAFITFCLN